MSDPLSKRAAFLRGSAVFARMRGDGIDRLAKTVEVVRVPRRGDVWVAGEPDARVYLVRSGVVKLHTVVDGTRELTLAFHAKGSLIGEEALLLDGPRRDSAEAYVSAELYAIPVSELRARGDSVGFPVAQLLAERRAWLEQRLAVLLFKNAHTRLAWTLLELARTFGVRDSRGTIVNLKLTHKELAAMIGATRETVSFAIVDLRKQGLVLTEGKRVILLDPLALEAMIDG